MIISSSVTVVYSKDSQVTLAMYFMTCSHPKVTGLIEKGAMTSYSLWHANHKMLNQDALSNFYNTNLNCLLTIGLVQIKVE